MIVYDKLWETMKEKGISQYKLIHTYGISPAQITRLKKNSNVNTNTLDMLCEILDCPLYAIAEYKEVNFKQTERLIQYYDLYNDMQKNQKPQ